MIVSQCCAASIIYSDICSDCKEHTGFIYLCEDCEEEIDEGEEFCKSCDGDQERDQYADSE